MTHRVEGDPAEPRPGHDSTSSSVVPPMPVPPLPSPDDLSQYAIVEDYVPADPTAAPDLTGPWEVGMRRGRASSRRWIETDGTGATVDYVLTTITDDTGTSTGVVRVDGERNEIDAAGVKLWMNRWLEAGMQMLPLPDDVPDID